MNEEYWEEYYKTERSMEPSDFAQWVLPRIPQPFEGLLWDIGCGNGKDTLYFWDNDVVSTGVDPQAPDRGMFTQLPFDTWKPLPIDIVYARWFLHAVSEEVENLLLEWCQGTLFIEARVKGDSLDDTHNRRHINIVELAFKLQIYGYDINYLDISDSFSVLGDDKPVLFRLEAQRWT